MNVLRNPKRSRWLLAAVALVVIAAVAVVASGVAAESHATAAGGPPVVDRDYIYGQLFELAYSDVYRVSGADGPPTDPKSPWNLPSTVNGWQEFFQQWKHAAHEREGDGDAREVRDGRATTTSAACLSSGRIRTTLRPELPLGLRRRRGHDPRRDVPGPARAARGASGRLTPVSPDDRRRGEQPAELDQRRHRLRRRAPDLTLSNIANGGAYDDTSGVALTMGEYQALLRWYDANQHVSVEDAQGRAARRVGRRAKDGTYLREGAKYYAKNLIPQGPQGQYAMFAEMNANGISYPAYHLGTQYFWNNIASGGVGPWRTFITDTPSAPNALYPDTGAGSAGANIAANSAAIAQFDANLKSAVTAGFAQQSAKYGGTVPQENPLRYNHTGSGAAARRVPRRRTSPPTRRPSRRSTRRCTRRARPPRRRIDARGRGRRSSGTWASPASASAASRTPTSTRTRTPRRSRRASGRRRSSSTRAAARRSSSASGVPAAGMTTLAAATAAATRRSRSPPARTSIAGQPFFVDTGLEPRDRRRSTSISGTHGHDQPAPLSSPTRAASRST